MNPELTRWTGPEGLPRFDLIADGDFAPAFDRELAAAEAAMEAIAANPEPPTFANTVAALETAEGHLLEITVADTGIGIAPEAQTRIFEPFTVTAPDALAVKPPLAWMVMSRPLRLTVPSFFRSRM